MTSNDPGVKPKYLASAVFLLILAITAITDAFAREAHVSSIRSEISAEADALARDVSDVIARESAAVNTLAAFVELGKDDPKHLRDDFPTFAEALVDSGETIRAVQLAPGSTIKYIHPLEGNEAAMNLDLLADPDRRALLLPAIEDGTTVIQGPVELVQGGLGVLVRRPVYNEDGSYWGMAAILLDWPSIAELTQLDRMDGETLAGARLPDMGEVIIGEEVAFENDPVKREFRVGATDTVWEIAVRPSDGWPTAAPASWYIWGAGIVVAILAGAATFVLAARPEALRREREKARAELAFAEARYQATFQQAGVGVLIADLDGRIISVNPAIRRIIGLADDEELEGTDARELVHPDDRARNELLLKELMAGRKSVQAELRANGPDERWCRTNTALIDGGAHGRLFVSMVEDVTVRRNAEVALARSEMRFRQLFEQAPIAIQREDHSGVVEAFAQLRAMGVSDIRKYLEDSPEELRRILGTVRIIDANPAARELQGHLETSEGQLTLLDRLTEPTHATFIETLVAVWEGNSSLEQSVETLDPDGLPRHLNVRWHAPSSGPTPDYANVMVTIADITELREVQNRLELLIESKDRFLASVAHELRTPLTAVVGFAQELRDDLNLYGDREKEEFRELIAFHSSELSHIIEDLLVWARGDIGEVKVSPESIDLGAGVRRTLTLIPGLDLEVDEPDGSVMAYADPARLRQIVRNLATNAVRYGGEEVLIQVRRQNGYAVVEVRDNGPRLGKSDMNRIFEPYARADGLVTAPGSIGLGLTVSRSLARLQGGDLVCVREGSHNVFRVSLPIADEQLATVSGAVAEVGDGSARSR